MTGKLRGFTLIELLISLTLLSLIVVTGSYTYVQLASRWDKELGGFHSELLKSQRLYQLDRVISGITPYVIRSSSNKPTFFFVGSESSLLAVTSQGLQSGQSEVFKLSIIKNESAKLDLVYQSTSLNHMVLTSAEQVIDFEHSIILLKDINTAKFDYFGWPDLSTKIAKVSKNGPRWFSVYSSLEKRLTPTKLRFSIDDTAILITLDHNANRWLSYFKSGI